MKQILVVIVLLSNFTPSFSQDYPNYSINTLDRVFNQRIDNFTGVVSDTSNKVIIDTSIISFAKQNIYFPTSIGLHFRNVDSLLNSKLENLGKKEIKFIIKLKTRGIRNINPKEFKKMNITSIKLQLTVALDFAFTRFTT